MGREHGLQYSMHADCLPPPPVVPHAARQACRKARHDRHGGRVMRHDVLVHVPQPLVVLQVAAQAGRLHAGHHSTTHHLGREAWY